MNLEQGQQLFALTTELIAQRNWDLAQTNLEALERAFPERESIKINLLTVLLEKKLPEKCERLVNNLQHSTSSVALQNCGKYFELLNRFDIALEYYTKALGLDKNNLEIINCCSVTCAKLGYYEKAAHLSESCFSISKDSYFLKRASYYYASCCNWNEEQRCWNHATDAPHPFFDISRLTDATACKMSAENYTREQESFPNLTIPSSKRNNVTIGFLSGEFREHATTKLLISTLEDLVQDPTLEIVLLDNGPKDNSKYRQRLESMGATIHDIRLMSDDDAYKLIRAEEIDVLINLNGFFGRHRNALFFRRSAPIQINYLGFPGTMGHPAIDYLIGDEMVTPLDHQNAYTETIINIPGCYQPQDSRRVRPQVRSRAELNLPENKFLYCCLNNNYKITQEIFNVWTNILKQTDDSVLLLLKDNQDAEINLLKHVSEAGLHGRVILISRQPTSRYLQTLQQCDLFLDTFPYNAHTTCADALFMGLPVLTLRGSTFPSRVASSILKSYELSDYGLSSLSLSEYEERAISLCSFEKTSRLKHVLDKNHRIHRSEQDKEYPRKFSTLIHQIIDELVDD